MQANQPTHPQATGSTISHFSSPFSYLLRWHQATETLRSCSSQYFQTWEKFFKVLNQILEIFKYQHFYHWKAGNINNFDILKRLDQFILKVDISMKCQASAKICILKWLLWFSTAKAIAYILKFIQLWIKGILCISNMGIPPLNV